MAQAKRCHPLKFMKVSDAGIKMLVEFEDEKLYVYRDPVGLPTFGVGHLVTADEKADYPVGKKITKAISREFLRKDLERFEDAVQSLVKVKLNQNQFDALVSLAFNIGVSAFKRSSVLRHLNAGKTTLAANAFLAWNKADGRVLQGLVMRRNTERSVFLTPVDAVVETATAPPPVATAPVEVPRERPSLFVSIGAIFTFLTGVGINAGQLIQQKLEAITPLQFVYAVGGLLLIVLAVHWYRKSAKAAQVRNLALIKTAADPEQNTVTLK